MPIAVVAASSFTIIFILFSSQSLVVPVFVCAPFCGGILLCEVFHCRLNTACFMRDVRLLQAHFNTSKRGNQHQVIEVA